MYCQPQHSTDNLTATLQAIPDGRAGTVATLKIMSELTNQSKKSLAVRNLAVNLIGGTGNKKDWFEQAKAIQIFVRDKIRYVKDIRGVETVQTAEATLRLGYGDCDDKSVLVASLLESIGHPTKFVAIGKNDEDFIHVYPETRIGAKWIALETTEPVEIGWKPSGYPAKINFYN